MNKPVPEFRVELTFDMSWGVRSRLVTLSRRTRTPKRFLSNIRLFGYLSRGRYIPATRLVEARITRVA